MAVSQLNDLGGLDGRKVEILSRDDGGRPESAVRRRPELVNDDKVDLLAGGFRPKSGWRSAPTPCRPRSCTSPASR